jgi:hypothetical protein
MPHRLTPLQRNLFVVAVLGRTILGLVLVIAGVLLHRFWVG